jgi:DNA-binding SARP family transcriptional activator
MFFGYLGPLHVDTDGTSAAALAPRQRTVLAVLLTRAGRPVAVDELAEFVWDGQPPHGAADTLRTYVMRLRRALGTTAAARIVTRDPGYLIEAADDEVDALRFARACREGAAAYQAGRWADARITLADSLQLWRGDPLADIPSQLLRDAEVPALRRQRLQAMHWRIEADLQLGGGEELVAELEALTAQEPLREQSHALLMTALARAGRTSEALAAYRHARDLLISQLGIEPGPELRELQRLILAGEQVGRRPSPRVPVRPDHPVPHQLPAAAAHFAGRKAELKELDAALGQAGTVTISAIGGMAGIGKTTLALHWAHQVAHRFPDGQLYVNLRGFGPAEPMSTGDALRGFLDALRDPGGPLPNDPDAQAALYRSLTSDRKILIVLDNARDEQQVRPLLPGSPGCLTVITSRNQLAGLVATNGATPLSLDLLTEAEARELLSRRLGPERLAAEPAAVDEFVAGCTGLPLALCIAAAHAALTPGLSLTALSAHLSEPGLDALSGTDPYADLRSVFSWSYERLSPEAARLFRCLPLFPGPDVSSAAAASVAPPGRTGALLSELTSTHLLEEYVPGRFRLHDLLARYAQECSERVDTEEDRREVQERILTWYCSNADAASRVNTLARPVVGKIAPPDPRPAWLATDGQAMGWLETERRNLIAAVELAGQLNVDTVAIALPLALRRLFQRRSCGPEWIYTHLIGIQAARRTGDLDAEAYLHGSVNAAYIGMGRAEEGLDGLRMALAVAQSSGDPVRVARAHALLCGLYCGLKRLPEAIAEGEQAVALAREGGSQIIEGQSLVDLGGAYQSSARPEDALTCYLSASTIEKALFPGEPTTGFIEAKLAAAYLDLGHIDDAIATASAALELSTQAGRPGAQAQAHQVLGEALQSKGRHQEARPHLRAALTGYQDIQDVRATELAAKLAQ